MTAVDIMKRNVEVAAGNTLSAVVIAEKAHVYFCSLHYLVQLLFRFIFHYLIDIPAVAYHQLPFLDCKNRLVFAGINISRNSFPLY